MDLIGPGVAGFIRLLGCVPVAGVLVSLVTASGDILQLSVCVPVWVCDGDRGIDL